MNLCDGVAGARWVRREQLHLTLRFLGHVSDEAASDVQARLRAISAPRFGLALRGVGVFPEAQARKPPRVLWAGIVPKEPMASVKAAIDQALGPDEESERRGFSPHLTLARFSERPGADLTAYLAKHADLRSAPFAVQALRLYESQLRRTGAIYTIRETYPLSEW